MIEFLIRRNVGVFSCLFRGGNTGEGATPGTQNTLHVSDRAEDADSEEQTSHGQEQRNSQRENNTDQVSDTVREGGKRGNESGLHCGVHNPLSFLLAFY